MPHRYVSTGLALLIDALAVAVVAAVLALVYWMATGTAGSYLAVFSNGLFIAGSIILMFGALIEFFRLKGTREIRRLLDRPKILFDRLGILKATDGNVTGQEPEAGWALVFLGAILIAFSIVMSLEYLI